MQSVPSVGVERIWRAPIGLRIFVYVVFAAMIICEVVLAATLRFPVWLAPIPVFAVAAYRLWTVVRPRLVATADGIEIHDGRRHETVAWQDISYVEVGYSGTVIHRTDGGRMVSRMPQKANISTWLDRDTPADEAATYIGNRAALSRGHAL